MWIYYIILLFSWDTIYGLENRTITMYKAEGSSKPNEKPPFIIRVADSVPEESAVEEFPWHGMIIQPSVKEKTTSNDVEIFRSVELDFNENSDFSKGNLTVDESLDKELEDVFKQVNRVVSKNGFKAPLDTSFHLKEAFVPTLPPLPGSDHSFPYRKDIVQRSAPEEFTNNFDFHSRLLLGRTLLRKEINNAQTSHEREGANLKSIRQHLKSRKSYTNNRGNLNDNVSKENREIIRRYQHDTTSFDGNEEDNSEPQEHYQSTKVHPRNSSATESVRQSRSRIRNSSDDKTMPQHDNVKTEIKVKSQPIYITSNAGNKENSYDLHSNILVKKKRKERPTVTHWDFGKKTQNSTQRNAIKQQQKFSKSSPEPQKSSKLYTYSNTETYQNPQFYSQQAYQRSREIPVTSLNPLIYHREILRSHEESQVPSHEIPWNLHRPQQETQVILINPFGSDQSQTTAPVLTSPDNWHPVYLQEAYIPPYPIFFQQNGQAVPSVIPVMLRQIQQPSVDPTGQYVFEVKHKE